MRAYMQARRARIRAEMVARLGGHCAWCPSTDDLQFDHKDPATKLFAIASGLDRPRGVLLAEVDKCQLLCGPHHVEKTADDEPYPNRARGERHGQAKLTAIDVADMRSANGVSGSVLADALGVSKRRSTESVLEVLETPVKPSLRHTRVGTWVRHARSHGPGE